MFNREYPRIIIDTGKLEDNARTVTSNCARKGINITGIVKGFNGILEASKAIVSAGCAQIGSSRLEQLIELKEAGIDKDLMLIRIPMVSEAAVVAQYVEISLQSEIKVIEAVNRECAKLDKVHSVILMADLGDLREGYWNHEEMIEAALYVEKELRNIKLLGVGTNLGCYGSIKPTVEKMRDLINIAEKIENRLGRKLDIISGGATSSYPMVLNGTMPERINHLRIGEEILLAKDLKELWGVNTGNMNQDVFTFEAEIIEIKEKASYPVGEIFVDCFGKRTEYEDVGNIKRAIVGAGRLDYYSFENIRPRLEGIRIIGDSSDHMILDITYCEKELEIGDILQFDISYPGMLFLTAGAYVKKLIL